MFRNDIIRSGVRVMQKRKPKKETKKGDQRVFVIIYKHAYNESRVFAFFG